MAKDSKVKIEFVTDTSQFDNGVNNATRRLREFGNTAQTSTSGLAGFASSIKGMTAALGLADLAQKAITATIEKFNDAVLHSSQTVGDTFDQALHVSDTAINELAYSVANFDFTNMYTGFDNLLERALKFSVAMDQLGNTLMSYNFIQAETNATFQEHLLALRNAQKGTKEYQDALKAVNGDIKTMDKATKEVVKDTETAIKAQISQMSGLSADQIDLDVVREWVRKDATAGKAEAKQQMSELYDIYKNASDRVNDAFGFGIRSKVGANGQQTLSIGFGNKDEQVKQQQALNDKYRETIVAHTLLEKMDDDTLKTLGQQLITLEQQKQALTQMEKSRDRAMNGSSGGGSVAKADHVGPFAGSGLDMKDLTANDRIRLKAEMDERSIEEAARICQEVIQDRLNNGEPLVTPEAIIDPNFTIDEDGNIWAKFNEDEEAAIYTGEKGMDLLRKKAKQLNGEVSKMSGSWAGLGATFSAVGSMMDDSTGKALSGIGSVMSAVAQLIPKLIGEAVVTAEGTVARTATTWYEIIPGIAAVTAAIYSAIQGFEEGGVVGGSSYSGDRMLIRANSGERVLTAEQNAIFESLLDGGGNTGSNTNGNGEIRVRIRNNELTGTLRNASNRQRYRY